MTIRDAIYKLEALCVLDGPSLQTAVDMAKDALREADKLGGLDRLRELVQADQENCVRILPLPRENTCGKCKNFVRESGCAYGECKLRPGLRPYQSRVKCRKYIEKEMEESRND